MLHCVSKNGLYYARATVEYLNQATPEFISPDLRPPTARPKSSRLQNVVLPTGWVYQQCMCDIDELKQHLFQIQS